MGVMARQLLCPCIVGVHIVVKVAPQCTNLRGAVELLNGKASTRASSRGPTPLSEISCHKAGQVPLQCSFAARFLPHKRPQWTIHAPTP